MSPPIFRLASIGNLDEILLSSTGESRQTLLCLRNNMHDHIELFSVGIYSLLYSVRAYAHLHLRDEA